VVSRHADPVHGLAFDFLSNMPGGPHVMTGHEDGVITLNAEEAEDAVRERIRAEMREPYRTLLGHFRHEIGHYYWDLLVQPTPGSTTSARSSATSAPTTPPRCRRTTSRARPPTGPTAS
jgi:hypothetical protein